MPPGLLSSAFRSLPKAELHLHLEGSLQPATLAALAARHGIALSEEEVRRRFGYRDFMEFIEAFKWVCSLLREPDDYGWRWRPWGTVVGSHVVYAELTLSVGVMLLRRSPWRKTSRRFWRRLNRSGVVGCVLISCSMR